MHTLRLLLSVLAVAWAATGSRLALLLCLVYLFGLAEYTGRSQAGLVQLYHDILRRIVELRQLMEEHRREALGGGKRK